MSGKLKTYVVLNPYSANGATGKAWPRIEAEIKRSIGAFDSGFTKEPQHATALTREALGKGYDMIVSVGGDGTNNEVVNGFFDNGEQVNSNAIMGIMPGGTGGDLSKTLRISRKLNVAADVLKQGSILSADVGRLSFISHDDKETVRYFINIASFGISGEVDEIVNRSSKALGGKWSFIVGSARGLISYRNKNVKFRIDDGEEVDGKIFYVAVANGKYFGAGMKVAPDAKVDDGLFDIVIAGDLTKWEVINQGRLIYNGEHLKMKKINSARGRKLTAVSNEPTYLDVDGEGLGKLPAEFEILPGAIKLKAGRVK